MGVFQQETELVLLLYMALYTGKGDKGTTKIFNTPSGERISKASCNIETLGAVDELNSFLGLCKANVRKEDHHFVIGEESLEKVVHDIQEDLFSLQAELAGADKSIPESSLKRIEHQIALIEEQLPPITSFLIAGGTELSALFDVARTLARKAERRIVDGLEKEEIKLGDTTLAYINRLSSILYACVRFVNECEEAPEVAPHY